MGRIGLLALLAADGVATLQITRMLRQLPDRVASHFNAAGVANGWMTRDQFVHFSVGIVVLLNVVFFGLGWGTSRLPVSLINLPNRDYWLSEERREETVAWLSDFGYWMGALTVFFLDATNSVVVRVALGEPELAGAAIPVMLGGFLAVMIGTIVRMALRFRLPS